MPLTTMWPVFPPPFSQNFSRHSTLKRQVMLKFAGIMPIGSAPEECSFRRQADDDAPNDVSSHELPLYLHEMKVDLYGGQHGSRDWCADDVRPC